MNAAQVNEMRVCQLIGGNIRGTTVRVPYAITTIRETRTIGGEAAVGPHIRLRRSQFPDGQDVNEGQWLTMATETVRKSCCRDAGKVQDALIEFPTFVLNCFVVFVLYLILFH